MKILFLSDDFPPQSFGGAGFSTFYLARGIQKAGHQVFVVTTVRHKKEEGGINYQGLKIFRIYSNYHPRWRAYLSLYNPWTLTRVRELIKETKPDIVHAHNIHYYLSYHSLKIAKEISRAVFWTARDTMSFTYGKLATKKYLTQFNPRVSWWDNLKQAQKRYNPLRNFLIKKYLNYADIKFAVSYALKEALEENGIRNVEVNYSGINVDDWQITPAKIEEFKKIHNLQEKKIIFCGGRMNKLKGLKQLEKAVIKVKEKIAEAFLLIAGKEGIGWLEGEELKTAYWSADVVVVPSLYLDPFPRVNLEAMACKKPVIGTCFGGTPEIVRDNVTGYIVNPLNIELMADKIIDLLKNPQKAKQFGEAGYNLVKTKFSIEKQVDKILEQYYKFL